MSVLCIQFFTRLFFFVGKGRLRSTMPGSDATRSDRSHSDRSLAAYSQDTGNLPASRYPPIIPTPAYTHTLPTRCSGRYSLKPLRPLLRVGHTSTTTSVIKTLPLFSPSTTHNKGLDLLAAAASKVSTGHATLPPPPP